MRMFVLYGALGRASAMQSWLRSAPTWVEVRILELPGHGFRTSPHETPVMGEPVDEPLSPAAIAEARQSVIRRLADDIWPLVHGGKRFAFYGFSQGALLAYLLCAELASRGAPPPVALFASGRGAPNALFTSREKLRKLQTTHPGALFQA